MNYPNSVLFAGESMFDSSFVSGRGVVFVVIGLFVFLLFVLQFELLLAATSGGESAGQESKVNCLSCGARTTTELDECTHCGEPTDP